MLMCMLRGQVIKQTSEYYEEFQSTFFYNAIRIG